jgi:ketosteroid isomerase-like protein
VTTFRAAERARELLTLAGEMRVDEMLEYFARDVVMELPYAPGKMARRYDGFEAVSGFMAFARNAFSSFTMTIDALHETTDPLVVIAEHHSDGIVAENGRPYRNRYVTFIHFDDGGRVVAWREHYDPGVVVRAFRASP